MSQTMEKSAIRRSTHVRLLNFAQQCLAVEHLGELTEETNFSTEIELRNWLDDTYTTVVQAGYDTEKYSYSDGTQVPINWIVNFFVDCQVDRIEDAIKKILNQKTAMEAVEGSKS